MKTDLTIKAVPSSQAFTGHFGEVALVGGPSPHRPYEVIFSGGSPSTNLPAIKESTVECLLCNISMPKLSASPHLYKNAICVPCQRKLNAKEPLWLRVCRWLVKL